jgi:hypothetical protein
LVITGGQFGKVFVTNYESAITEELIDQVQAHKRKVVSIKVSKDYLYTVSSDQKVKQWSLSSFNLVFSTSLEWIPSTMAVANDTLFVGGSSKMISISLLFRDKINPSPSLDKSVVHKEVESRGSGSISSVSVVVGVATFLFFFVILLILLARRNGLFKKKLNNVSSQTSTSVVTTGFDTQTLVTNILKISLPGYKEINSMAFRFLRMLAKGGGGEVYLGEALTKQCMLYGNQIIIKRITGNLNLT